jgi:hypothetical protein
MNILKAKPRRPMKNRARPVATRPLCLDSLLLQLQQEQQHRV